MELRDYWHAVRDGWRLVLVVFLLALAGGVLLTVLQPARYTATTELFVAARTDSQDPEELYERNQVAAGRMESYSEVIGGDSVAELVSEEVSGEPIDTDDVETSVVAGTVVLEIAVSDESARRAADVAAAYAAVAPDYIRDLEVVDRADDSAQVRLTVVDPPEVSHEPASPDPLRNLVLAALLGLGAGLGAAVVRMVWRREISRGDDA